MVAELTPLLKVANALLHLAAPPSIKDLISHLGDAEQYEVFVKLVRRFTPEAERDVLAKSSPTDRVYAFAQAFEHRYFPLDIDIVHGGDIEEYAEFTQYIPVVVSGMSEDDYENLSSGDYRIGCQLISYLLADPYMPDRSCHSAIVIEHESGARVALYDACNTVVPAELLDRVPEGGLSNDDAHKIFDSTKFEAVAHWSDIIGCCTGNFFLDTDYEMLCQGCFPDWSVAEVERLTQEWLESEALQAECAKLWEWLDKDPKKHFEEILYFMERGRYVAQGGPDADAVQLEFAFES